MYILKTEYIDPTNGKLVIKYVKFVETVKNHCLQTVKNKSKATSLTKEQIKEKTEMFGIKEHQYKIIKI